MINDSLFQLRSKTESESAWKSFRPSTPCNIASILYDRLSLLELELNERNLFTGKLQPPSFYFVLKEGKKEERDDSSRHRVCKLVTRRRAVHWLNLIISVIFWLLYYMIEEHANWTRSRIKIGSGFQVTEDWLFRLDKSAALAHVLAEGHRGKGNS
jgi:hypothetical protein